MASGGHNPLDVVNLLGAGAVADAYKVNIAPPEHPEDRAHRHRMEDRYFIAGIGLLAIILTTAIVMVGWNGDPDMRKTGAALLTSIVSGALGFVAGKAAK